MSTIAFFNIPAAGHVNPTLGVVGELVRRGHRIVYYNTEDQRAKIERTGAEFRVYPPMDAYHSLMQNVAKGDFAYNAIALMNIGEGLMPFVLEEVAREKPDAIMFDSLASWGRWASELNGIPGIGSITTFVLTPANMPRIPLGELAAMAVRIISHLPAYRRVRASVKRRGIRDAGLFTALMNGGGLNLVYTARAFQPKAEKLGSEYVFVGASIDARGDALDIALDGRPLVFVSMGTLHITSHAFFRAVFDALEDLPVQVVVSTGRQTDLTGLTPPDNITMRPFVAQLEILKHAAVFITHGGMNSTHEGLMFGVPLAVVPQQTEQMVVAQQVEAHGAGIVLREPENPAAIRAAVETLLSSASYKEASARLGQSLREAGGASAAADAIENYLGKR